jgi:CDGSH iron-sulfur domain-containing protein 3
MSVVGVPHIAQKSSIKVSVEAGKTYYWCRCGLSKTQPMCDGSHQGGLFTPMAYVADTTGIKSFCACKHTANPPFCDGTHRKL